MQTLDSKNQRTALIVEYDVWDRWLAASVLEAQDYRVVSASNGASALRLAQQHPCAIILINLTLPELRGLELLDQLRATASSRKVPIIMLSKPLDKTRVMLELDRVLPGV